MAFRKAKVAGGPTYGGNINIWLNKSKEMSEEQLAALHDEHPNQLPQHVVLLVVDADKLDHLPSDPDVGMDLAAVAKIEGVLVVADLDMDEFSSGAIGYKYRLNRESFTEPTNFAPSTE